MLTVAPLTAPPELTRVERVRAALYEPRLAMADRDGGCTYPGCDRPPAWTEAHHIDCPPQAGGAPRAKDGGATDLERGTLLCARRHHWVHAEDIHIRRRDGQTEFRINGIWQINHRRRP